MVCFFGLEKLLQMKHPITFFDIFHCARKINGEVNKIWAGNPSILGYQKKVI